MMSKCVVCDNERGVHMSGVLAKMNMYCNKCYQHNLWALSTWIHEADV